MNERSARIKKQMLANAASYNERAIKQHQSKDFVVDTARVYGTFRPIETAVSHPEYNDGLWIIVQAYDTEEDAVLGHDRWVEVLEAELPDELVDCINGEIAQLWVEAGGNPVFRRQHG